MTWISVNDKMPNDVWIEEMSKKYPNVDLSESIDQILFECLVNFVDTDENKVYDCEVVPVMYSSRDGWMRNDWSTFSDQDVLQLTHWMFIPDAVSCKDAKVVYDENLAK